MKILGCCHAAEALSKNLSRSKTAFQKYVNGWSSGKRIGSFEANGSNFM